MIPTKSGRPFADFENGFGNWKPVGNAFSKTVSKGSKDSHSVLGYSGVAWASSFNKDPKNQKVCLFLQNSRWSNVS